MIVLDLEGLIYRFLDSLPNYYFMSEGADEECIGLDSGRGCIKLRNFNKDISIIYKNGSQISLHLLGRDEECLSRHQISWLAWHCIGSGGC